MFSKGMLTEGIFKEGVSKEGMFAEGKLQGGMFMSAKGIFEGGMPMLSFLVECTFTGLFFCERRACRGEFALGMLNIHTNCEANQLEVQTKFSLNMDDKINSMKREKLKSV